MKALLQAGSSGSVPVPPEKQFLYSNSKATLHPEDRRGQESAPPPGWTIFDPSRHQPPRGVIATLDDLAGWTAETEGLSAAFGVTPAQALWGKVGAFVEIRPAPDDGTVTLRPPRPIPIPEGADLCEVWVTGDTFDWQGLEGRFALAILFRTPGRGGEISVVAADWINWPTYSVRIIRLPASLQHGGAVTGLRLSGHDPTATRRFGLDRLCACRDIREPLALTPRPKRPLSLPAGQAPGLNVGPGYLPFPTRATTILPENLTAEFRCSVERQGDTFRFQYSGRDVELAYVWSPASDPLRLTMEVDGRAAGEALSGATAGGTECVAWVAANWLGNHYVQEDPLPAELLHSIPSRLRWRGKDVPSIACPVGTGDAPRLPPYDIERHGGSPIYHMFRQITAEREMDVRLELSPPKEHTAVWLDGTLVAAERKGGKPPRELWNGVWSLHLKPGTHIVAIRVILWLNPVYEIKPLPAGAAWSGPWHVFGPSTYNAGATQPRVLAEWPLVSLALKGAAAEAIFDGGRFGPLLVRMQMMGKSMAVDLQCLAGELAYLQPGRFLHLFNGRVRKAPGMRDNALLLADVDGRTLFFSLVHDWYRSNASHWTGQAMCSGREASLQGPLLYLPRTDGARNGFFERYLLTASRAYEEVLPTIPNPVSPWAVEAGRYVFQESWGPVDFDRELAKVRAWAACGMTDILHLHHEAGWAHHYRSGAERGGRLEWLNDGCTLRLDVAPLKGGNEALRKFLAAEQALGLRAGLYTNYTALYPLNSLFRSDRPILRPDGSRQTVSTPMAYAMKPSLGVEYEAWFAPRIAREYHPTAAYTDVHTCVSPWGRMDFDERVPGAATFASTYYAFGELLWNDQRHYAGPVFSEGGFHWMYAGLASGNYGQIGIAPDDPPDPAFNLLKIHPLETDVGLGIGVVGWIGGAGNLEGQVDRYLLAVLTYGHIAYLPEEPFDRRLLLRVYHMARAVSMRYAGLRPTGIHYQDEGGQWLTLSEAHARGLDAHCRLRVAYPGGLMLYANWSRDRSWSLAGEPAGAIVVPPDGYWFGDARHTLCASVLVDGARCDRAQTPSCWYADGRGRPITWGPLTVSGSAALHIDAGVSSVYRLVDGGGNQIFRIAAPYAPRRYRAVSLENEIIAERDAAEEDGGAHIEACPDAVRYEWDVTRGVL